MPNITLRIDNENLVREAKILAAKRGVSLSRILADYLEDLVRRDSEYEKSKAEALRLLERGLSLGGAPLTREEAHARADKR